MAEVRSGRQQYPQMDESALGRTRTFPRIGCDWGRREMPLEGGVGPAAGRVFHKVYSIVQR